jgi:hypothetical protein
MPAATPSEKRSRRAISAPRWQGGDQIARNLGPVAQDRHHAAEALGQSGVQPGVLEHETQHLRQAVAHQHPVALEVVVVREVELANTRCVAAAAQVFQQQSVVKLPQLLIGQAQLPADVHADPAAAHAMPRRLAFGDVERIAERCDQFRQFKCIGR